MVDEAQALSARSLALLRPTIRKPGSEIWFSWNPRRKSDAVDEFLRQKRPSDAIVVEANWRDNPWFPQVLEAERQRDLELYPDRYAHIWDGAYAGAFEGAYFGKQLAQARAQVRIGRVGADPLLRLRAFFDLGGAGARADAMDHIRHRELRDSIADTNRRLAEASPEAAIQLRLKLRDLVSRGQELGIDAKLPEEPTPRPAIEPPAIASAPALAPLPPAPPHVPPVVLDGSEPFVRRPRPLRYQSG
jgi:Phage terminase large subunit